MKTYTCVVQKNQLVQIGHLRKLTGHFFALFNVYPPVGLTFMKSLAKSIIDIYWATNGISSIVKLCYTTIGIHMCLLGGLVF
jgi:hypothetical protein